MLLSEESNAQGNQAYTLSNYELAWKCYSEAIRQLVGCKEVSPYLVQRQIEDVGFDQSACLLLSKYFTNRAAVALQQREYNLVLQDTDVALVADPTNVKAYLRR
jgi:hypothetical protein